MSRTYHKPAASTARQPLGTRPPLRPPFHPPASTIRGARAPIRGRTMHTQPPRPEINDDNDNDNEINNRVDRQERTTHVGDGYHMFTPSTTKREQMKKQAETEQRQYEEHRERARLHNIHEVHRLGGDELSEDEVRRRQAEQYRRDKFTRLEKTHQDQIQKKQEEEKEIEAKKQAARLQAMENEKRDRNARVPSMRPTANQGATGYTDKEREEDRQKTMNRFLDRLSQQPNNTNTSSNENFDVDNILSESEKFSLLRDALPHVDDEILKRYYEIYNGNVDMIVQELLNEI